MPEIVSNILFLKKKIPTSVKIVAVSKTRSISEIMEAYDTGHRSFGENRVQEILSKKEQLPGDIEWHLIGHLQSNKVKYIVPFIRMIHSVDSFRLLKVISSEAGKAGRIIDCLLQFHIAGEETKFGFIPEEVTAMLDSEEFRKVDSVRICGVMGMATFTEDTDRVREEFRFLSGIFKFLKSKYFHSDVSFSEISMGMSGDFKIAIEEGSTIVRIGSIIFGERT